ncbi:MAG TPA: hypothetical protein VGD62_02240 [Acidobacteriaceae bacterium]
MGSNPSAGWIEAGEWLLGLSSLPLVAIFFYLILARQWVRYFGRPATATVLQAVRVAHLPYVVTEVALALTPPGEPHVRIRVRMRWSDRVIDPELLTPGAQLPVRYRLARQSIAMPDARRRSAPASR